MIRSFRTGAIFAIATTVVLAVSACSGGTSTGNDGDEPYVFGVHTTLTGPSAYLGTTVSVGFELAVKEINENGGINGHPIELVIVDDKGTPDGGLTAARQLVERDNALVVMSGGTSSATVPVVPYFKQNGVPYIVSVASDPKISEELISNVFSGATVPTKYAVPVYADYIANELGAETVAMIVCDNGFCTSAAPLLEDELAKYDVRVVANTSFNQGDTDFTGQAEAIRNSDADVVFILGNLTDDGRIIPQFKRAGVDGVYVLDVTAGEQQLIDAVGPDSEGLVAFWIGGNKFIGDRTGAMEQWLDAVDEKMPDRPKDTPSLHTLMSYADVYVVAEAIRLAGDKPNFESISQSLESNITDFVAGLDDHWTFASPVGLPRTFTPENHVGTTLVVPLLAHDGVFTTAE